jgi:hypothetical protein
MDPKTTDTKTSDQIQEGSLRHPLRLSTATQLPANIQTLEALESYIGHSLEGLESQFSSFMTFNSRGLNSRNPR